MIRSARDPALGMLFAGVRVDDIAATMGLQTREVRSRALRIIGGLQARDRGYGAAARPTASGRS